MELENKLKELEALADKLDAKDVPLEEGIRLFESGVALIRDCLASLDECKGKITVIRDELESLLREDEIKE